LLGLTGAEPAVSARHVDNHITLSDGEDQGERTPSRLIGRR
jgi:hypothetical protein